MAYIQRSCLSCGSSLVEGERFCGNCGHPANASPDDAATTGRSKKWAAVLLGAVALLIIAFLAYIIWAYANIKSPKPPTSGLDASGKPSTAMSKADAYAGFSLTRPTKGWPVGQYRAIVYLNGVEAGNTSFSVK